MKIENVVYNNAVNARIFRNQPIKPGVHFYSEEKESIQVGKQLRMKGEKIKSHKHNSVKTEREEALQEVLYIEKGKIKVIFYNDQWKEFDSRVLNQGDLILLIRGGHGFEILEETEMIEIKQGPYNPSATERMESIER